MSFDLSRIRFDPRQDFLGVVMQQGRVQLDADWNEWLAQLARRIQAGTVDTFNGTVVPRITPNGFLIEAAGGALSIGPGRIYVDGILAENHGAPADVWDPILAEERGSQPVDYTDQPYYPDPPDLPEQGTALVYLDVWQRAVTHVEDPKLVEQAVGVDTTGRVQTVWQVKALGGVGQITCATPDEDIEGWLDEIAPSAGRLSTDTAEPVEEPTPCEVPPAAGYRGLENQLYRIEVHDGGVLGDATFKWSRDNASVGARVTGINPAGTRITLDTLGRDDVLTFHDGDWVEVTDDFRELHGMPGDLRQISPVRGVDRTARTLTLETAVSVADFPTDGQQATDPTRNTRVRSWDQAGSVRAEDGSVWRDMDVTGENGITIPDDGTRLFLEHGILVDFTVATEGGEFHTGDYWVVAARTANASVEILDVAPPLGIHHHYARLAVVTFPNAETDCRTLWPPLGGGNHDSCDCTVCVTAEEHNAGTATIQQAIDAVQDVGGTVCLGAGTFTIEEPLTINQAQSLKIRGQGWRTILMRGAPGPVIDANGGIGVLLESFTVLGLTAQSGNTSMITAINIADFSAERINVLGISTPDARSSGITLGGVMLRATITDCAIAADIGVDRFGFDQSGYLLSADLKITRNAIICNRAGVRLSDYCMHFANSEISGNFMLVTSGFGGGVEATGACFPGSSFNARGNVIYSAGYGMRAALEQMNILENEIGGVGESSSGIQVSQGLDTARVDRVRISGNRVVATGGDAIGVNQQLGCCIVSENFFEFIGGGVLVMGESGGADMLQVTGNCGSQLGLRTSGEAANYTALQVINTGELDVVNNSFSQIAIGATTGSVTAIRTALVDRARISGNRLIDLGPLRGPQTTGIRLLPPFDKVSVDDNTVLRRGTDNADVSILAWLAVDIGPDPVSIGPFLRAASMVYTGESAYLLTANRLIIRTLREAIVSIRGNQFEASSSTLPLVRATGSNEHCLFTANTCHAHGQVQAQPSIGLLQAQTITVTDNRLRSLGDLQTMTLQPGIERAIAMGNTTTGPFNILGASVPPDFSLTNIMNI